MPTGSPQVPSGKITAFDKRQYDNLTSWLDSVDQDLNTNLAKPKPGVRLDSTLGGGIYPGSANWTPAATLSVNAKAFGGSVAERYAELSKDWEQFVTALRDARDLFEKTNDLTHYDASKFVTEHPEVSPSVKTTGGNGPGPA
jgi:hypothetical protein